MDDWLVGKWRWKRPKQRVNSFCWSIGVYIKFDCIHIFIDVFSKYMYVHPSFQKNIYLLQFFCVKYARPSKTKNGLQVSGAFSGKTNVLRCRQVIPKLVFFIYDF